MCACCFYGAYCTQKFAHTFCSHSHDAPRRSGCDAGIGNYREQWDSACAHKLRSACLKTGGSARALGERNCNCNCNVDWAHNSSGSNYERCLRSRRSRTRCGDCAKHNKQQHGRDDINERAKLSCDGACCNRCAGQRSCPDE
jgi:hypothetical protein